MAHRGVNSGELTRGDGGWLETEGEGGWSTCG